MPSFSRTMRPAIFRGGRKGVTDAAAVGFDVEPREGAVRKGGVFFELEGGRVGVRGDDLEGAFGAFPDDKCDERAAARVT